MDIKIHQSKLITKAIVIVSVLLFFAVLVFLGKDAMLSYRHPTYQFSIKYPSNWIKLENHEGAAVIFLSPKDSSVDSFQENVNVVVQDLTDNVMSLQKYTDTAIFQVKVVFKEGLQVIDAETRPERLSGKPGYQFVYITKGKPSYKIKHVWTVEGNRAYQVTYTALANEYDSFIDKADKMIDSFRIP